MADSKIALQGRELGLVENLRDKAHIFVGANRATIGNCDTRTFLPTMLQRIEAKEGKAGYILAGSIDPKDAAFLVWVITPHQPLLSVHKDRPHYNKPRTFRY
jgi:hypothetical protein